jgi:adenosyl cobinamide kinase/adenosyl cobinamide phosphate guanylyltransferase
MLWLVIGGVGSGKSAFAWRLAEALGREAILLACPAWPDDSGRLPAPERPSGTQPAFRWKMLRADADAARKFEEINFSSNPFRIDQRVVVFDGLAGWLRGQIARERDASAKPDAAPDSAFARLDAALDETLGAILGFDGRRIVVTEEPLAGLAADPWERWYLARLSTANLRLASACAGMYRVTAGAATELKGSRTKRGNVHHETLYPNGR